MCVNTGYGQEKERTKLKGDAFYLFIIWLSLHLEMAPKQCVRDLFGHQIVQTRC